MGICMGTGQSNMVLPSIVTHEAADEPAEAAPADTHDKTTGDILTWKRMEQAMVRYPTLIERYVLKNIDPGQLKKWLSILEPSDDDDGGSHDNFNRKLQAVSFDHDQLLELLSKPMEAVTCTDSGGGGGGDGVQQQPPSCRKILVDFCRQLAHVVTAASSTPPQSGGSAANFRVYLVRDEWSPPTLTVLDALGEPVKELRSRDLASGHVMAGHAACVRQQVQCRRPFVDADNFPEGIDDPPADADVALCQPIVLQNGVVLAVLELYKSCEGDGHDGAGGNAGGGAVGGGGFSDLECTTLKHLSVMAAVSLYHARQYQTLDSVRHVHEFIFDVTKSIFQDMVSMDSLIVKIMKFARKLVSADRASLFLVDSRTKELYSRIFDMGSTEGDVSPQVKEIRIEVGTGIAGQVAVSGQGLNIADVYSDDRFNRSVDSQTGYITRSLLCMPIFNHGSVIGVMQMVNKTRGAGFTKEDEQNFEFFAVYCGLALYHARLYEKIRRSEKKYKVALEVLSYHNSCTEEEVTECKNAIHKEAPTADLNNYDHNVFITDESVKVQDAVHMFLDLFGSEQFDVDSLIRFTLTVRKNYRRVSYHNWTHGFSVANMMYCILVHNPEVFSFIEAVSMYVGCLCHDLDHRGRNNKFMLDIDSPLAAIYTTSTMEHHHFNQTVSILQQEGHNILRQLSSAEYKQCLSNIKHCVLATDLALFFNNKMKLDDLIDKGTYDWKKSDHRLLLQAIVMTACDLCASCKPWKVHMQTVADIFEEFYDQGDEEKRAGRTPLQLMDRKLHDQQAHSQVGFLGSICIPCYHVLQQLIPETNTMLVGCRRNLDQWLAMTETGGWQQQLVSSNAIKNTVQACAEQSTAVATLAAGQNLSTELALEAAGICVTTSTSTTTTTTTTSSSSTATTTTTSSSSSSSAATITTSTSIEVKHVPRPIYSPTNEQPEEPLPLSPVSARRMLQLSTIESQEEI